MREAIYLKTKEEKKKLFLEYYKSDQFEAELRLPDKSGFHHFRFECFSENRLFKRVRDVINDKKRLLTIIIQECPKNVFFTPVKWLDPINVRRKRSEEIKDYMISSPLYFDIDMQLISPPTLNSALCTAQKLIDYMEERSARKPDWIIFSGKNGFHIYYWKWDDIAQRYYSANERIKVFRRNREEIVDDLRRRNIVVDSSVTTDPWRVLRVPGTLHGDTGLIAKALNNLNDFSIEAAKP
jgi:DNA primase catalytic subunit